MKNLGGICQIFYTSKIPKLFNFTCEKCVDRDIFGQTLRMEDALLIYFEHIVSFLQLSTQTQAHSSCFVKTRALIGQISQIE